MSSRAARGVLTATALVALLGTTSISPAIAQTEKQKEISGKMSDLRGQMGEMSEDQAELVKRMADLEERRAELDAKTKEYSGQIAQVQTAIVEANARLQGVQERIEQAEVRLKEAEAKVIDTQRRLQNQAVDAYMGGTKTESTADLLLRGENASGVTAASEYRSEIIQDRKTLMEQQRVAQHEAADARVALDETKAAAERDRDAVVTQQAVLKSQKASLDAVRAQAAAESKKQDQLMVDIESKKASIQAQLDGLQRQSDSIAAQLRAAQAPAASKPGSRGTPPPTGKGILANPLPGYAMNSPFGMRVNPVTGRYALHAGQDFAAPTGTPVRNGADGTVTLTMPTSASGGYGNYVCVDHGNGLASCYAHLSQILVSVGQKVTRNQIVGLVGSTGYSTGPHLHYEVRVNGTPVDPRLYL